MRGKNFSSLNMIQYSLPREWCYPQWADLPTAVNRVKITSQRPISQVIVLSVNLTVDTTGIIVFLFYDGRGKALPV